MSAEQPELDLTPPADKKSNGRRGLRMPKRRCGYCGLTVALRQDGSLMMHGPQKDRCVGADLSWAPVVVKVLESAPESRSGYAQKLYGTCGICGDVSYGVTRRAMYYRQHDHSRPRLKRTEDGWWAVVRINHRSGRVTRQEYRTYDEAIVGLQEFMEIK